MSWATRYIERLQAGETVQFRPRGGSMKGKIDSGQLCTVVPIADHASLVEGDIVLCRVRGTQYLHLIKAVRGGQFQIGNNRGGINGWISAGGIFGRLVAVSD
ncbi:hypothetical protein ACETRX_09645 [Labrys portucalensis]|uniref:Peptidase S24/S26A/S26B/S26C domain-containing protein n=1 Tax=Labrys neptuniae TaxID=376174 RepID=A0ABV6ZCI7_9HYPH